MKKLFSLLTLTILVTVTNLKATDDQTDKIIQTMLDVKIMNDLLSKERGNKENGVFILDNAELGEDLSSSKYDQPVRVIDSPNEANGQPYIMINESKIKKGKKAILKGTYDGSKLKFKCKKTEEGWMFTHLSLKGNGRSVFEVEF
ncbi:MAG: hypothetical protein RIC80_04460 [Cyclobacteriaceae bacterium]